MIVSQISHPAAKSFTSYQIYEAWKNENEKMTITFILHAQRVAQLSSHIYQIYIFMRLQKKKNNNNPDDYFRITREKSGLFFLSIYIKSIIIMLLKNKTEIDD